MEKEELRKVNENTTNHVLKGMVKRGKLKDVFKKKTKKL